MSGHSAMSNYRHGCTPELHFLFIHMRKAYKAMQWWNKDNMVKYLPNLFKLVPTEGGVLT